MKDYIYYIHITYTIYIYITYMTFVIFKRIDFNLYFRHVPCCATINQHFYFIFLYQSDVFEAQ